MVQGLLWQVFRVFFEKKVKNNYSFALKSKNLCWNSNGYPNLGFIIVAEKSLRNYQIYYLHNKKNWQKKQKPSLKTKKSRLYSYISAMFF